MKGKGDNNTEKREKDRRKKSGYKAQPHVK